MVPKQELQTLAGVLKATPEYADVMRLRRRIFSSPMGNMMQSFEREHARLSALGLSEREAAERFKRLYEVYGSFLDHPAVKEYARASQTYERVVTESIDYLYGIAGTGAPVIRH
jgi:hypothetical protein